MKQTAVEQLGIAFRQWQKDWYNFEETGKNKPVSYDEFIKPFLEMEKQQQGYSEEEVQVKLYECLGHFAQKHNIIINGSKIDQWFEKFKKP